MIHAFVRHRTAERSSLHERGCGVVSQPLGARGPAPAEDVTDHGCGAFVRSPLPGVTSVDERERPGRAA